MTESVETFGLDDSKGKPNGLSWIKVKVMVVVFVILLLLVGLLSGLLAAKSAREEVEEKYAKIEGMLFLQFLSVLSFSKKNKYT